MNEPYWWIKDANTRQIMVERDLRLQEQAAAQKLARYLKTKSDDDYTLGG
jgi:hypothetical protein